MSVELHPTIEDEELATLLMPIDQIQLVLPNVTVAEIIPFSQAQNNSGTPSWYLGTIAWRNLSVPLISFEEMNGQTFESSSTTRRIAIINGLHDMQRLPFWGIVIEGVPRLMRLLPTEVSNSEGAEMGPSELARVLVSGVQAIIPDVDYIQRKLLHFMSTA